jgi:hypothetical protein
MATRLVAVTRTRLPSSVSSGQAIRKGHEPKVASRLVTSSASGLRDRKRRAVLRRASGPVGSGHSAGVAAGRGRCVVGRGGTGDIAAIEPPLVGEALGCAVEEGAEQVGRPEAPRAGQALADGGGEAGPKAQPSQRGLVGPVPSGGLSTARALLCAPSIEP